MNVTSVKAHAYTIPTDSPEADGTLTWDATTMVTVTVTGDDGATGLGWTYASPAAVQVVAEHLAGVVRGSDTAEIPKTAEEMARACRNLGRPGVAACAISAVDVALWDLRARQLGLSLADLLGRARDDVPVYGSGGFTSYDDEQTEKQLSTWVDDWGIPRVKIKIGESWGTRPERDLARVGLARRIIGDADLFVDANGGYQMKQAHRLGQVMGDRYGVTWFEEPVSSDDLPGLARLRKLSGIDIAAGEYGFTLGYFQAMLAAGAVDCLQADITRCGGVTVWRQVAALADAHHLQISGHCAPNLHAQVAVSVPNLRHVEYFHDHHRIETTYFEGALSPQGGAMVPDPGRPGHGMTLLTDRLEQYRVT
ncbi:MAG TPA: enolase C-terminal domain-like protein [Acidimicrobiales bacterium]|nr:enolase C-terminal domain-like protein [Acidimicrobiales bacterium]